MNRKIFVVMLLVLALAAVPALAAGSESKPPKKEKNPGVSEYNDGVKLMKKGKYPEAQKKFELSLAKNKNFAEAHNNLAFSLRKQGEANWDKALEHYNSAIELNARLSEAYMYRGMLYSLMGNEEAALEDHATLTQLNRKLADELQAAIASGEEPDGLEGLAKAW